MNNTAFEAFTVEETAEGKFLRSIKKKTVQDLPEGDVLVKVSYSSLNYKDALSASGNKGVTRRYPHTPGIDAAGVVDYSDHSDFHPGDKVIVSGYDLGMNKSGGFGQFIRVPADWVVKLPDGLTLHESMIYGTAGFTAAQSVYKLMEHGVKPGSGEVLVTGATGGVGSVAVAILAKEGFDVVAASGKAEQKEFLTSLGAKRIISREQAMDESSKALLKERWNGVIDTVGGGILTTALKSTKYGGVVTCCGNVASPQLYMTVYPFILRGITLAGIDSANCNIETRKEVWQKIAGPWKLDCLDQLVTDITLAELDSHIEKMLHGDLKGRTVVNLH